MPSAPIHKTYYQDFPLSFRLGSYLALFRPMTIPHLAEHLYDTSRMTEQTFHRLQTTRLLIKQLVTHGTDSDKGRHVIEHMNKAHANVVADNDGYRYVLCCFFLEPFRWNRCFDSHSMDDACKQLVVDFWCQIGRGMGIGDLLADEAGWLEFQREYETAFMGASEKGALLAYKSLMETPRLVFPPGVSHLARQSLLATMDVGVRDNLGLQRALVPASVLLAFLKPLNRLANTS